MMNIRNSSRVLILLAFVFTIGMWTDAAHAAKGRLYTIVVQTADASGAGTDAAITLQVDGTKGSFTVRLNELAPGNSFERGQNDVFKCRAVNVGNIVRVRVFSDGKGSSPDWYLRNIIMITGKEKMVCQFSQWIGDRSKGYEARQYTYAG